MSTSITDEIHDLAGSSLWSVDMSWSDQALVLRNVAIHNHQLFSLGFARNVVTQLRIVEKKVCYLFRR